MSHPIQVVFIVGLVVVVVVVFVFVVVTVDIVVAVVVVIISGPKNLTLNHGQD